MNQIGAPQHESRSIPQACTYQHTAWVHFRWPSLFLGSPDKTFRVSQRSLQLIVLWPQRVLIALKCLLVSLNLYATQERYFCSLHSMGFSRLQRRGQCPKAAITGKHWWRTRSLAAHFWPENVVACHFQALALETQVSLGTLLGHPVNRTFCLAGQW